MSWSHPAFESIAAVLSGRTGLSFSPPRRPGAEQGIRRAMRRAGVARLDAYCQLLEAEETALDDLIVELTVGETYFFREPDQFAFLRREVLPVLRARVAQRMPAAGVRAWSAGCATGEEAYSLAMLFDIEELAPHASVLGTDISHPALARARQALYTSWSLRGEGAAQARPYLDARDGKWIVVDAIRRLVTFAHLNLALDVYPSLTTCTWGMDVILCRNVLIYFDADTVAAVARRMFASLAPGGWLILASSDPPLKQFAPFEVVLASEGVFYRRGVRSYSSPQPPSRSGEGEQQARRASEGSTQELRNHPEGERRGVSPPVEGLTGGLTPRRSPTDFFSATRHSPPPTSPSGEGGPQARIANEESGGDALSPPTPLRGTGPGDRGDPLAGARAAFALGEYHRVLDLIADLAGDAAACALGVRALANLDAAEAERACAEAARRHSLCPEMHYLHGTLLLALGRDVEAVRAVRAALYLDRSLAAAHCTLGAILERSGDEAGALRAFRNARDLCVARPADEEVPLTDGEHAGRLAEAARARLALLGEPSARSPRSQTASEVPK